MNESTHPTDPVKARNLLIVRVLSCQEKPSDAPKELRTHMQAIASSYSSYKRQGLSFADSAEQARADWLNSFLPC